MAKFKWIMLAILSLLILGGLIANSARWSFVLTPFMTATNIIPEPEVTEPLQVYCKDVLKLMVYGQWESRKLSAAESKEMKLFNDQVRKEKTIPSNLQRPDKLCGNVTFPNVVYRALCDPNGDTPCCYNNVCANKTQHQCICANCYDTRQPIDAEYATWRPSDPTCRLRHLSQNEIPTHRVVPVLATRRTSNCHRTQRLTPWLPSDGERMSTSADCSPHHTSRCPYPRY